MSTEVVARVDADGKPRPDAEVRAELGMVQVLGRICAVGSASWRWRGCRACSRVLLPRETVFLVALVVPAISVTGVLPDPVRDDRAAADRLAHPRRRACLRRGGRAARARRRAVRAGDHLRHLDGRDLRDAGVRHPRARSQDADDHPLRRHHHLRVSLDADRSATAISGSRSTCSSSTRRSTASCGRPARSSRSSRMWLLAKQITEYSVAKTLFWIAIAGTILSLPEHRAVLRPA